MGNFCEHSRQTESKDNMEIEMQIQEIKEEKKIKMLLLGTGNCGKSTLFKQIRQIYSDGFDQESDKKESVAMNRANCIDGMLKLLLKADTLYNSNRELHKDCYIYLSNDEIKNHIKTVKTYREQHFDDESLLSFTEKDWSALRDSLCYLWNLPQIKAVYKKQEYFSIYPNLAYFLDRIDQLFDENYESTEKDVIEGDIRTTGLVNIEVEINDDIFVFVDTGGQRNERKKWIHQFNNVDGVIFVAALDHYATVLFEDEFTNAMHESLECFNEVCNGKWFRKSEIILLLTRTDLFKQRLLDGVPLSYCFDNYEGMNYINDGNMELECTETDEQFEQCYKCGLSHIQNEYDKLNRNVHKKIFVHVVNTNDCDSVNKMLWDVQNILIRSNLKCGGIV